MEENPGYIPIYRKFFDHYLWEEKREYSKAEAWIDCIQMARYKKTKKKKLMGGNLVEWGYGQFPASIRFLKKRWGWGSNTKVENFLSLLAADGMIKIEKGQQQNIITLCKYSSYDIRNNIKKDTERTQEGQREDTERTERGRGKDTGRTQEGQNSKKDKKDKKGKGAAHPPLDDQPEARPESIVEVEEFFIKNGSDERTARQFYDHYNMQGWVRKNGMAITSWHSAASTWIRTEKHSPPDWKNNNNADDPIPGSVFSKVDWN